MDKLIIITQGPWLGRVIKRNKGTFCRWDSITYSTAICRVICCHYTLCCCATKSNLVILVAYLFLPASLKHLHSKPGRIQRLVSWLFASTKLSNDWETTFYLRFIVYLFLLDRSYVYKVQSFCIMIIFTCNAFRNITINQSISFFIRRLWQTQRRYMNNIV